MTTTTQPPTCSRHLTLVWSQEAPQPRPVDEEDTASNEAFASNEALAWSRIVVKNLEAQGVPAETASQIGVLIAQAVDEGRAIERGIMEAHYPSPPACETYEKERPDLRLIICRREPDLAATVPSEPT